MLSPTASTIVRWLNCICRPCFSCLNNIMLMETFSLTDNSCESRLRTDPNPYEIYRTKLVQIDQTHCNDLRDILRYVPRKYFRAFWFLVHRHGTRGTARERYASASTLESSLKNSYRNTACLVEKISPFFLSIFWLVHIL